jgi:complex iron-sulfur molybdoenzyme family reductase subunit gamma
MKKLIVFLTTLFLALTSLIASDTIIEAKKFDGELKDIGTECVIWDKATFYDVVFYPQTTIRVNDQVANDVNEHRFAMKAKVAAFYNASHIAFKIMWRDPTKNVFTGTKIDEYPDGFAVQFPQKYNDIDKLPYIGMGSEGRPVIIHLQKAYDTFFEPNGEGDVSKQVNAHNRNVYGYSLSKFQKSVDKSAHRDYQRAFVAKGFRSTTEIKDGSVQYNMKMKHKFGKWCGLIVRPLSDNYVKFDEAMFPVSFAVWDGAHMNRDGLKYITSWIPVKLEGKIGAANLVTKVNQKADGDVKRGEQLMLQNCSSCHNYGDVNLVPRYIAPNLSNIGGYAIDSYLRESIEHPSAVVVPGYNRNAHKNFQWYTLDDKGNRSSIMPEYGWLGEQSITDIITFLQTLKAEVGK